MVLYRQANFMMRVSKVNFATLTLMLVSFVEEVLQKTFTFRKYSFICLTLSCLLSCLLSCIFLLYLSIILYAYFYTKKDERFLNFLHPFPSINFFYYCASSAAFFAFSSATVRYFIVSVLISSFNSSVNCSSFTLHSQLPPTVDGVLILASFPNPR